MDTSVLELPAPVAVRLRRPGWRDPRLLAGLAMVAASVALGSWAVRTAQATVPVYVARGALVPGEAVAADRLAVVDVRLGTVGLDGYLSADEPLPTDAVVVRVVGDGELVPRAALGTQDDLDVRPVAVPVSVAPSDGMVVGSQVDLWFVPPTEASLDASGAVAPDGPRSLAAGLTVAQVDRPSGALAGSGATVVHVLVPGDLLSAVLAALASDGTVDVVPVPGTGG
ncbi:hypothetical protein [Cellulomonas soli]|uniref:Flagellar protein FlgA n=1 Tax=Cellulomonas soli TaxID=931535 RepID=A0A512PIP1_9CELL|nr:hypothetical protein [Cellulomonas soli]NYI57502.1 hypothetical protein [Cellulomonas soli]GEP71066.1 flagellar protein FlgA [Cellulomonas soli]